MIEREEIAEVSQLKTAAIFANFLETAIYKTIQSDYPNALSHPLSQLARAPKVDDLNGGPLGVAEEYVLRLEVAVDYVKFRCREEHQCCAQLLRKLPREIQRYAPEVGVPQEVVQVVGEQLKHQTEVIPPHEVSFQFH